ncbi:AAA family ATPase [Sphingomonas sp. RT2P30]|uniref:AAA family ATPase n=1 Tax=Parasphingomonas halimpatiens TaxID=3096162 RepID=UPI002FCA13BF
MPFDRHVALSGCSGGGKSSLIAELARRGHCAVEEPGRRIVAQELAKGGSALPWIDPDAFARRAFALASEDRDATRANPGFTFFDRGLVDAAVALEHGAGIAMAATLTGTPRYHGTVFLAPPWREIYAVEAARRHDFAAAEAEYHRLSAAWPALGYHVVMLPLTSIAARADFVLATLGDGTTDIAHARA